jgi:hypothetical protein
MPYEPFRKNYRRTQQPPLPGSEREYIDQELRKIQEAFSEVVSQTTAIQTIYPDPPSGGGGGGGPHTHIIADVTGLQTALDGKQPIGSYAATIHGHVIADVTGLQTALDGKQPIGSYAATIHGHVIADVTGLQTALDGKQPIGSYAAASHSHVIADTTGLQAALNSKAVLKTATITIPNGRGRLEHIASVADVDITSGSKIQVSLAGGLNSDENDPELLDVLSLAAVPSTGTMNVIMAFGTRTSGPIKINYSIG